MLAGQNWRNIFKQDRRTDCLPQAIFIYSEFIRLSITPSTKLLCSSASNGSGILNPSEKVNKHIRLWVLETWFSFCFEARLTKTKARKRRRKKTFKIKSNGLIKELNFFVRLNCSKESCGQRESLYNTWSTLKHSLQFFFLRNSSQMKSKAGKFVRWKMSWLFFCVDETTARCVKKADVEKL